MDLNVRRGLRPGLCRARSLASKAAAAALAAMLAVSMNPVTAAFASYDPSTTEEIGQTVEISLGGG